MLAQADARRRFEACMTAHGWHLARSPSTSVRTWRHERTGCEVDDTIAYRHWRATNGPPVPF